MTNPLVNDPALAAQESRVYKEMHASILSIQQAQTRRDLAQVRIMRQHFAEQANIYVGLGRYDASPFLTYLARVDDWIENAAKGAYEGATKIVSSAAGAVTGTLNFVPLILPLAAALAFFLIAKNPGNFGLKR